MLERSAQATWKGDLKDGRGTFANADESITGNVSFQSRFKEGKGSNPEELLGAAEASCFGMALSNMLSEAGYDPQEIDTVARVQLNPDEGKIPRMVLDVRGRVPGINETRFREHAKKAAAESPVAVALGGMDISLGKIEVIE